MMLLLLAAPKHVLPVMAMHLLKALCVRAVDPSYSSQLRPWNTPPLVGPLTCLIHKWKLMAGISVCVDPLSLSTWLMALANGTA